MLAALLVFAASTASAKEPAKVVVTIAPVHSLVAGVMQGAAEPKLLFAGAGSFHTYALKPSDTKALKEADAVFWVGEGLEGFMVKALKSLPKQARVVELAKAPGVKLLKAREGGVWEDDAHGHAHGKKGHADEQVEMHIWLDPVNAEAIVRATAAALAEIDPERAAQYRAGEERTLARLKALDGEIKAELASVGKKPFVVFHDAYQYFEARYGLAAVGAITVSPERKPSAKRLSEIRAKIQGLKAACVFAEPQFDSGLVATVAEGTGAKTGVLDPEGATLPPGPELYPQLLKTIAASLKTCLGGTGG
jgi:zinc transport system substrate-binding protein